MFYCEKCRKKWKWPEGLSGSHGRCELCGKTADCYDIPSSELPPSKTEKKPKKKGPKLSANGTPVKMTPPDPERCQCERPKGNNFMTLGGKVGLARCRNKPIVIAREKAATHEDGEIGEMSLCPHCMNKMTEQMGADFAAFRAIEHDGEDKGVQR